MDLIVTTKDWDELYTIEEKSPKGWEVIAIFDPAQVGLNAVIESFRKLALNKDNQYRLTTPETYT